jgi:integrase
MTGFAIAHGRFYPWWNGEVDAHTLRQTTARLSQQFGRIFAAADCADLTFHDLRHEATSRVFERTTLSDVQISRITGHKDPRVLRRYSNLRGSELARKLW